MRQAFSDALVSAAKADRRVLLLTGDHGYALFDAFRRECPEQYLNCGVAEQNMVGVAAGLARAGFRPIVYGLAAFVPIRVLEQIKIDVCYENLPVVFIGDGAGFVYSYLGSSHQSMEDIACTRALPGMTVFSPADRFELTAVFDLALQKDSPSYLRLGKADRGDVHSGPLNIVPGSLINLRSGTEPGALIATGSMVKTAIELADDGLHAELWSAPTIKPIDSQMLEAICQRVDWLITLEEHSVVAGLGDCVGEVVAATKNPIPMYRIGVEDRFSQHCGSYEYLLREHGLDTKSIRTKIDRIVDLIPENGSSLK